LQLDKWAALQEYANYFVQRLNKVKQSILPNYIFIPEAPAMTFDSFTGLQRMITVQLSFTLVVPTNCEPVVTKLVECIANIVTSSNLTASLTTIIKLVSTLQASSSLSASALVSKLAQSNLNTESSLSANIQIAKLASSSLNAGATLSADALVTRLFAASLNGNGSLFANPLITKFAASSLNTASSLAASALVSKLAASSLTGAGTTTADLTVNAAASLLLDLYPNAGAAYSLRKLRSAYTGSAIRVRRSSDNTEQDIGFAADQLDTVSLLSFCGVGNGFVTTWYDQSGNARNATQTTAANQPRIVNGGVIELQINKPALRFISTNQQLLITSTFNLNTPVNSFSVFKYTDNIQGFVFDGLSVNTHRINLSSSTRLTIYGSGANTEPFYNDATGVINKNYLSDFLMAGPSTKWQLNNNTEILANTWINGSMNGVTLGRAGGIAGFFFNGFISEYILYPNNQNTNSSNIKTNINTYYAIY
jgi:hypothetical protein